MEKEIRHTIFIKAAPGQVWDTITNPDKIAKYMFGARTDTDWKPGSNVDYYIQSEDKTTVVVAGKVLKAEPPYYLEHTLFPASSSWAMEDIPENYLTAIYKVEPKGDGSELTVIQHDFEKVARGEKRYNDAQNGWKIVLHKMKEVAESGS
jgi:uncharacterized protein YndB with AHSA1/START domain